MSDIGIQFHRYHRHRLLPVVTDTLQPQALEENFRRVSQQLADRIPQGTMEPLAILLGGVYFHQVVVPGTSTEERELRHNLGYIPTGIVAAYSVTGMAEIGSLMGQPLGGPVPGNTSPWTVARIYIAHRVGTEDTSWNLVVV